MVVVSPFDILDRETMRSIARMRIRELNDQLEWMTGKAAERARQEIRAWQAYLDNEDDSLSDMRES